MFKRCGKRSFYAVIIAFVFGMFWAFILPPVLIVIIEGLLLIYLCWCCFCGRKF